ncbi:hypothetical protein ACFQJ7_03615 [Halovenus rubra]|uniref:Uncharacterized protein n=2 Tax=Halovenus rubra TaxID=869890 RepID=A0ACC7E0B5_9EURY|nr:hypothetical protein [Halovenus rubra]
MEGKLESRISKGGQSLEFLEENFDSGPYNDVVYVSANPYTGKIDTEFFELINVWDSGWNSKYQTVLPETVTQAAIEAHEKYPNKRLIVHYMQPHLPFIGEQGMEYRRTYGLDDPEGDTSLSVGPALHYGLTDITTEEAWNGYIENLSIVLDSVAELLDAVDGKSVLTADHGELFGEWIGPVPTPMYGHTPEIRKEELVKVPWFKPEFESRREIVEGSSTQTADSDPAPTKDRLRDLGYL